MADQFKPPPPLPPDVFAVLQAENAPARLVAHLQLVHDAARQIVEAVQRVWPALPVDRDAVLFGAATHDIGKARARTELQAPGKTHEAIGELLLREYGVSDARARFARTHGAPVADLPLEDLLVIAADTAWKGKRTRALDDALGAAVAAATGDSQWRVFMELDAVLGRVAAGCHARLAWQGAHGVL